MLAELFEMCLYTELVGHCGITGKQFEFEKCGGCEQSISTVIKVVNYFLRGSLKINFRWAQQLHLIE